MPIKIKTVAITGERTIEIKDLETVDLNYGEVLVKVHAVALCTLEQRIFKGEMKMPLPCTGGHEVSGEIVSLGPGVNKNEWNEGLRVAVRMLYNCGECHFCRTGHTNMCVNAHKKPVREGLLAGPGGLCDYIVVKTQNLFVISDNISYEEASLTEPLACCVHSVRKADPQFAQTAVVIGCGIMGLNHVQLLKKRGCRVILCEVNPQRRKLAESMGADITFSPEECNPVEFVKSVNEGRGADFVFNTTALSSVFSQAVAMTGKFGKMIQYSSLHPDMPTAISPQCLHGDEIILTGSISPTEEDFYIANRLINYGIIDMKPAIGCKFDMKDAQKAFEHSIIPGTFRSIIEF